MSRRIGVISDTHGHWDPKIADLFEGVDLILHAGDIGTPWVIVQLENIAPVTAVLGNTDSGLSLKDTEIVQFDGYKILVHHILDLRSPAEAIRDRILREKPNAVVFGHSHRPFCETVGGILYLNPGYAGKPRFKLPRSVALMTCTDEQILPEHIPL
jgi:uncharacterized protein